jgi:hypothetical protein
MDWNNICLIAQLLNLTIPSAHLEYDDRFKAGAHQGNGTLRRNDSFQESSAVSNRKSVARLASTCWENELVTRIFFVWLNT